MRSRFAVMTLCVAVLFPVDLYAPPIGRARPVYRPPRPVEIDPYRLRHNRRLPTLETRSTTRENTLREWGKLYRQETANELAERQLLEVVKKKQEHEITNQTFPWPDVMRDSRDGKTYLLWSAEGSLEAIATTREQIYAINRAFEAATDRALHMEIMEDVRMSFERQREAMENILKSFDLDAPRRDSLDLSESTLMLRLSEPRDLAVLREVKKKPQFSSLTPRMQLYLTRVAAGYDMRQAEAFADLVYARALMEHQRYSDLSRFVDELPRSIEEASTQTQQLRASVECLGYTAKGKIGKHDPLALFADFIALHTKLDHAGAEKYSKQALDLLTKNAEKEIRNLSGMAQWQRASKKLDIVGFADAPEHTYVFVKRGRRTGKVQSARKPGFDGIKFDKKKGKVTFLTSVGAQRAFLEHCYKTTKEYSTPEFTLAATFAHKGGYTVHASEKTFRILPEEWAILQGGTPLPAEHPLTAHMHSEAVFALYSHPLAEGEVRFHQEIDAFAFALRKAYPEAKIVKDDLTNETVTKATQLVAHKVKLREMVILAADKLFEVTDWNVVNNAWVGLAGRGMNVKRFAPGDKWTDGSGRDVIVITGHANEQLAAYVRALGEAGVFRGNYVIFNACETPLTSRLAAEINTRYGAMGTHAYEGKIPYEGVRDMLLSIADEIDAGKTELELDRWWREIVRRQQMNGVWMICRLLGGHTHA